MHLTYIFLNIIIKRLINLKLIDNIYNNKEFMNYTSGILEHEEFIKTKNIVHHGGTRYNHSLKVAYLSYKISKGLKCDVSSATRAGALHDFFLQRDDRNIATEAKMFVKHPSIAKKNAINYFGINEKEQNIIESHMFPFSTVAPKSKEAWIVTISDKIVSAIEASLNVKAQVTLWILFITNFIK